MRLMNSRTAVVISAGVMANQALDTAINGEVSQYMEYNQRLAEMVSEGQLTPDQAGQLKEKAPSSNAGLLIGGAVLLGGLALYFKTKDNR